MERCPIVSEKSVCDGSFIFNVQKGLQAKTNGVYCKEDSTPKTIFSKNVGNLLSLLKTLAINLKCIKIPKWEK